jgi:hypothetical protein
MRRSEPPPGFSGGSVLPDGRALVVALGLVLGALIPTEDPERGDDESGNAEDTETGEWAVWPGTRQLAFGHPPP